jgi:hypothetical protein
VVIWHIPPPFWYIVSGKIWQPWYRVWTYGWMWAKVYIGKYVKKLLDN